MDVVLDTGAEQLRYVGPNGTLVLRGIDAASIDGDILFVDPRRGIAHRLIRASSIHNTLLITERCDQLCAMCSQPPKAHHVDMFPYFEAAALLAPRDSVIGISGGEPTLFKDQLWPFLRRVLRARPDLSSHILTNAQHIAPSDLQQLSALPRESILWGIPLYAADPRCHDEIVGKEGAFERLIESLGLLCRVGAQIELRTVVMRVNASALPVLARFVTSQLPFIDRWALMQLENIGYGRKNWGTLFYDSAGSFTPVAVALDIVRSRGVDAYLYNFPLCTVPEPYRHLAPRSISDWKQKYLAECDECVLHDECGGFFAWHPEPHGFSRLGLQ
ncbi:MAG: His-Xaa-Ser system radical SAM maturase HxsC [Rhizobiaceae bacterium]